MDIDCGLHLLCPSVHVSRESTIVMGQQGSHPDRSPLTWTSTEGCI